MRAPGGRGRPSGFDRGRRANGEHDSPLSSWLLCDSSGGRAATYRAFDPASSLAIVHLEPEQGDGLGVAPYLGRQIESLKEGEDFAKARLTAPQRRLLAKIHSQVYGAKRGVFPWNIEAYDDVDMAQRGPGSPLAAVYCVAAGFKPYRILKTHGFGPETRVVFFDYSEMALEFRRRLLGEWDGANYPAFLQKTFRESPPDSYFQLWAGLSPSEVAESDVHELWKAETDRWGGEQTFQKHWNLCRSLRHEFVHCDLLQDPRPLFERIVPGRNSVVWWSNAFFTIYSNWFFTISERRERYLRFITGLAASEPELLLYGADHVNSGVNSIRAGEYAARLGPDGKGASDGLNPARFHRVQVRS